MCRGCFSDEVMIAHMPWRSGLEARIGGEVAGFLEYGVRGTWAVLTRTEVLRTHVVGTYGADLVAHSLVRAALDLLRARGHRILPVCPWARTFLLEHPDEVDGIDDVPTRPIAPTARRADPIVA